VSQPCTRRFFILANVRSYLIQYHSGYYIKALAAEERLTTICTSYLTFECFTPFLSEERLEECVLRGDFALQEYSACYWLYHLKEFLHRENSNRPTSSALASATEILYEGHTKQSIRLVDSQAMSPNPIDMSLSHVITRFLKIYENIDTIYPNEEDFRKRPFELDVVP